MAQWNADEFKAFSRALRRTAPDLQRKMRRDLRAHSHLVTDELKAKLPHQEHASAAKRGVRFSDSLSSAGGAVVIGGASPPQSWAFAFLYGNRGKGIYVHKSFGKWSSSPKMLMHTSSVLDDTIARTVPEVKMRVEATIESILQLVSIGL